MTDLSLTPLAFFNLGPWEVIIIALVALLLFGHRLPEIARSAGKAVVEFKKGMRDIEADVKEDDKPEAAVKAEQAGPKDAPKEEKKA